MNIFYLSDPIHLPDMSITLEELSIGNNAMATLEDLPAEIGRAIFSLVDIPSLCKLYVAL